MPLYEITHSHPLTSTQKETLAQRITYLHSRAFTTPSILVNVAFFPTDAAAKNYFVAGKVCSTGINRVKGYLRTSEARAKGEFDGLAERIEEAWGEVLGVGEGDGAARRLLRVGFVQSITTRELGVALPIAGGEGEWVRQHRKGFERRAGLGEEEFVDLLEELDRREDLVAWRSQG